MISGILDDIGFQELIRGGCRLCIGEVEQLEADFVAEKDSEQLYIQVCLCEVSLGTEDREFVFSEESMIMGRWRETPICLEHLTYSHESHWFHQWTP
ncbi:MAG: hypothetical protein WCI18_06290 [Pseudomonadota bacterium]